MRYVDRIVKTTQIRFKGLNHTDSAQDGEIYDMKNLTGDQYPLLSVRPHRCRLHGPSGSGGIFAWEKLLEIENMAVYYGGKLVGQVSIGEKFISCLAPYIVIFPDKVYYNYITDEFGSLESTWRGSSISFSGGIAFGEMADANSIKCEGANWEDYFRVGDAVIIHGCTKHPENNKGLIIRGINGDTMYFSENCFVLDGSNGNETYAEEGSIIISRSVPGVQYVCEHQNRLFGCYGNTIYASKLGDPFNWYVYDGLDSDSWSCEVGSAGKFTGCISYGGYPIFFKEDYIYKLYGSIPSQFSLQGSAETGVKEAVGGFRNSLAIAGGVLFYMSNVGVMAYTGGIPKLISQPLGIKDLWGSAAGSDGSKYYISGQMPNGGSRLYVYDTQRGFWFREDDVGITHFARLGDRLYLKNGKGEVWWQSHYGEITADADGIEEAVPWMVEFADFVDDDPNRKGFSKLQMRFWLEDSSTMKVMLQFDSDGVWHTVKELVGTGLKRSIYLPIVPRRCDHYRLRLEGTGQCQIFSLAREFYVGSEL